MTHDQDYLITFCGNWLTYFVSGTGANELICVVSRLTGAMNHISVELVKIIQLGRKHYPIQIPVQLTANGKSMKICRVWLSFTGGKQWLLGDADNVAHFITVLSLYYKKSFKPKSG